MSVKLSPVLLCALLGACSFMPQYQRPEAPVPQDWPALEKTPESAVVVPARVGWRDFFTDERLKALIATALENNRDLRIAVARIEEARAQYGVTSADRLPSIDATAGENASRGPVSLGGNTTAVTSRRYDVAVSLPAYEIDFWGRVRSLTESARSSFLATREAARAARLSLISDVANAYFSVLELDERVRLTARTLTSREEALKLTERRERVGVASGLDSLQQRTLVESARADLASLKRQLAAAQNALNLLVGARAAAAPGQPLSAQVAAGAIDPGVPSEVLLARPDVLAAEERLRSANANIGAARAAFFPRVTLTASAGFANRELDDLFDSGSRAWSFLPQIRLPLFDAGRNQANLDLATARKNTAVADYERTIQQAFREAADALTARSNLNDNLAALVAAVAAQTERLRIAERRYQEGLAGHLEVLDAQRELYTAEQNRLQVLRQQAANTVQLYKALGGGQI